MPTSQEVYDILTRVKDPEIPVLTIFDLGILRDVELMENDKVRVTISPTYSGCPAMDLIEEQIGIALRRAGICLLYTSPSPRDLSTSRMPSSA